MTETYSSIENTAKWYGEDWNSLSSHLPNNFAFISDITRDTSATVYKEIVDKWMLHMPSHAMGQASWFLGNHDRSRIASRTVNLLSLNLSLSQNLSFVVILSINLSTAQKLSTGNFHLSPYVSMNLSSYVSMKICRHMCR